MAHWERQVLATALARQAAARPDAEALVIAGRRLTWAGLAREVGRMAAGLRALGIRRGDHVAVLMGNSLEWVTLFYAAATVGAVTVPVNTRFKPGELAYCLKQADVKLLFLVDRFLKIDFVQMPREVCPCVDGKLPDPALPLLARVIVLGSDVPAGAITLEDMLAAGAAASATAEDVRPDDVLPPSFARWSPSTP